MENKKQRNWKKYIIITFSILFIISLGLFVSSKYIIWRDSKNIKEAVEELEQQSEEIYNQQLSDTYGGETPQETLEMYIEALERGDYELASKYFVLSKQEEELDNLLNANQDTLSKLINWLRVADKSSGSNLNNDNFSMESETDFGPLIYISFVKYPNGVWKIIEM